MPYVENLLRSKNPGLPVPKMRLIFGHSAKRPGDLDLWPFDL